MRSFAIGLLCLNLLYLAWNLDVFGFGAEPAVMVRSAARQAPDSLTLLSDLPSEEREALLDSRPDVQADAGNAGPSVCSEAGLFEDMTEASAFMADLSAQGYGARIQVTDVPFSEYRVYMPPFNSEVALSQTFAQLRGSGFESFIISSGDLERGISLGVFSREDLAIALQEQLAGAGYASSILEMERSNSEIRVYIEAPVAVIGAQAIWTARQEGRSGLNLAEKVCETIAPDV